MRSLIPSLAGIVGKEGLKQVSLHVHQLLLESYVCEFTALGPQAFAVDTSDPYRAAAVKLMLAVGLLKTEGRNYRSTPTGVKKARFLTSRQNWPR